MASLKREQILQEAEKLAARGKLDAAVREYRRALDQGPADTTTLNKLGDLLVRANRIDEAIDVYQRIAEHFAADGFFLKGIAIYKKINRLDPQRTDIYERLADLYFKQGLVVEGRQQLVTLADWFLRSRRLEDGIRTYRKLVELEPTNFQARAKLVDLLIQAGDVREVGLQIEALSRALLGRGMLDEAVKLCHRALELGPAAADAIAPCVEALVTAGRPQDGVNLAEAAIRQGGAAPELRQALARSLAEAGEHRRARTLLEELLPEVGEDTRIIQLYGDVMLQAGEVALAKDKILPTIDRLLAAGDRNRAEGLVRRLLRGAPGDVEVLERALKILDRRTDPDLVETVEAALADAYFRAGRKGDALAFYRRLHQREPANRLFARRLAELGMPVKAPETPPPEPATPAPTPPAPAPATSPPRSQLETRATAAPPRQPAEAAAPPTPPRRGEPSVTFQPPPSAEPDDAVEVEFVDVELEVVDLPPAGPLEAIAAPPVSTAGEEPPLLEVSEPTLPSTQAEEPTTSIPLAAEIGEVRAPSLVTNADELFTEAAVFAKYGLTDKAIAHLHRLLALDPNHQDGRRLLAELGGGEVEELAAETDRPTEAAPPPPAPPVAAPPVAPPQPASPPPKKAPAAMLDVDSLLAAAVAVEPKPASRSTVGRVRLDDLEALLGIDSGTARRPVTPTTPPPPVGPEPIPLTPTWEAAAPVSFELPIASPSGVEEPGVGSVPPAVEMTPEPLPAIEVLHEELVVPGEGAQLVEVDGLLAGPTEDQLRELDFFIEQGLREDAARVLARLQESFADHPAVLARHALLKSRGWDEAAPAAPSDASASELFGEEEQFFDLAAELERELAEDELVATARGTGREEEESIEELFREFQRGVAEQLSEEDYDTHFNLGLAYREMGLLDEAIGEFQLALKSAELFLEAVSMIGACYVDKGLYEEAAGWYAKGLAAPNLPAEVEIGLHYEMARALEAGGGTAAALSHYAEVLARNPTYRDVVARVERLRTN